MDRMATAEQLREILTPGAPVYLLVDPILGEPIGSIDGDADAIRAQRNSLWRRETRSIPLSARTSLAPVLHPYLVDLDEAGDDWVDISLRLAEGERVGAQAGGLQGRGTGAHRIGGWLQSACDPGELIAGLSTLCSSVPHRKGLSYLRMADRRVLAWVRHIVGDGMLARALCPIQRWAYLDPRGRLATIEGHAKDAGREARLRFDANAWQRMERGDLHHLTLAWWLGERASHAYDTSGHALDLVWQRVGAALELAVQASTGWPERFRSNKDHAAWATLTLLYPDVDHVAQARPLFQARNDEEAADEPESIHALATALRAHFQVATQGAIA